MAYTLKKQDKSKVIRRIRYTGLVLFLAGSFLLIYFSFPLLSWKIYFEPAFAANSIETPVPKTKVLDASTIESLITTAVNNQKVNYSDAQNWFPSYIPQNASIKPAITTYNLSIPKIRVSYANVSTVDTNLSNHLVHYSGTPLPPEKGNAVIFGHSTLPQLFNPSDYKTIFAKAHLLKEGDAIIATINGKEYSYTIASIHITTPDDTSVFVQDPAESNLTLITCTPPGTTWKRLIIKAKLE